MDLRSVRRRTSDSSESDFSEYSVSTISRYNADAVFDFDDWTKTVTQVQKPSILEIKDDLYVKFDATRKSKPLEFPIKNNSRKPIDIKAIVYNEKYLTLEKGPDYSTIKPDETLIHTFQAKYLRGREIDFTKIHVTLSNNFLLTRTVKIIYDHSLKVKNYSDTRSKAKSHSVPEELVKATDLFCNKLEKKNAVSDLVPSYDELVYENYTRYFHGILHLEELYLKREYERLFQAEAYFRAHESYYELTIEDVKTLRPSIQIGNIIL